jgi:hypothetical protein
MTAYKSVLPLRYNSIELSATKPAKAMRASVSSNWWVTFLHLFKNFTFKHQSHKIISNTPAMPLYDAHFGGFFVFGGCA